MVVANLLNSQAVFLKGAVLLFDMGVVMFYSIVAV